MLEQEFFVQCRKKFGKKDSFEHTSLNVKQPAGRDPTSTTGKALNEELSAACDSSIGYEDVIEVSETVPAQSAPSEFVVYLRNHAFSDADSAYSELITSKFNDALCTVEKPGRIKSSSVWDIISQYPSLVQLISRVISCLPST